MTSLATRLGLRASALLPDFATTNHAPAFLGFHFILAYVVITSRHFKQWYGIDHQESPREDLAKYGEEAVRSGKITRRQLAMMRRTESAQANSVENYAALVGAMALASVARVEPEIINRAGLVYTAARIAYGLIYVCVDHPVWSVSRGVVWWVGNASCLWLLSKAAAKF